MKRQSEIIEVDNGFWLKIFWVDEEGVIKEKQLLCYKTIKEVLEKIKELFSDKYD